MENLVVEVIAMAVILFVVLIYLLIQWINESEFKSNLDYLEREVERHREDSEKGWEQTSRAFEEVNKRIEKLEKETKVSTVDRKDIFSNEYYERANLQALKTAKYAEFLATESIKEDARIAAAYLKSQDNKRINREIRERIQELEAIPYEFRTDTEREVLRSIQLTDPRNNINNK